MLFHVPLVHFEPRVMKIIIPILKINIAQIALGFPGCSGGRESCCNVGDLGSIPWLGRSLEGGPGNPFQYSCLENSHGQRNLAATVHGVSKPDMTERLSTQAQCNLHRQFVLRNKQDNTF